MNRRDLKIRNLIQLLLALVIIALTAYLSSLVSFRLDLTSEKRYTLSPSTRQILNDLDHELYIQIYLEGDMPTGFRKMRNSIEDMLVEFRVYSGKKITYEFIDPSENTDQAIRNEIFNELAGKGLRPTNVQMREKDGGTSQKVLFPGLILNYGEMEMAVNLLKNNPALPASRNLNNSIEGIEYELISSVQNISADTIYKIAFIEGHGELNDYQVGDITMELARYYHIDRGVIGGQTGILDHYAAVIIAKPEQAFPEEDKFVIDQYIMNGGKVLWLIEEVHVDWDSLVYSGITVGMYRQLNIEDQLFKYGVRVNPNLVLDLNSALIPVNIAPAGNPPEFAPAPWSYFPLILPPDNLSITRNVNLVQGQFMNNLDTVGGNNQIRKTILLRTSRYSRIMNPPCLIMLEEVRQTPDEREFNQSFLPLAVLLEGKFVSVFENRLISEFASSPDLQFKSSSVPNRMIVVADGDIIRNELSVRGDRITPLPLGQDRYTNQMFGNKDFIVNCVNYLIDETGLMELRSREFKLRLLDTSKIDRQRVNWQLFNTIVPVLIVVLFGLINWYIRKKRFT